MADPVEVRPDVFIYALTPDVNPGVFQVPGLVVTKDETHVLTEPFGHPIGTARLRLHEAATDDDHIVVRGFGAWQSLKAFGPPNFLSLMINGVAFSGFISTFVDGPMCTDTDSVTINFLSQRITAPAGTQVFIFDAGYLQPMNIPCWFDDDPDFEYTFWSGDSNDLPSFETHAFSGRIKVVGSSSGGGSTRVVRMAPIPVKVPDGGFAGLMQSTPITKCAIVPDDVEASGDQGNGGVFLWCDDARVSALIGGAVRKVQRLRIPQLRNIPAVGQEYAHDTGRIGGVVGDVPDDATLGDSLVAPLARVMRRAADFPLAMDHAGWLADL